MKLSAYAMLIFHKCVSAISALFLVGKMGQAPDAVTDTLPTIEPEPVLEGAVGGQEPEITEMQARLEALRS
jgi:hypothetical protein